MWIDTHAHIYLEQFDEDREEMLKRAADIGVEKIFLPNIDQSSIQRMNQMTKDFSGRCFPMIGIHPCSIKANYEEALKTVELELEKGGYVGIGEVGLDYYWDTYFKNEQIKSFKFQIELGRDHGLPIIIHSRDSLDETIRIVENKQDGSLKGIFHCFNGTMEQAKRIEGVGFLMGLGGVSTYKKADLGTMIKNLNTESFVLETDAPYLSPVPKRGKRNEPAFLKYTAQKIADFREVSLEELAKITTQNALRLFNI